MHCRNFLVDCDIETGPLVKYVQLTYASLIDLLTVLVDGRCRKPPLENLSEHLVSAL